VQEDIHAVVSAAGPIPVKVILETGRLEMDQIRHGATLAVNAGAHTVKTSSGFGFPGATREAVAVLRETVGPHVGVKASGGIRTYQDAMMMIGAGASRLGLSSTGAVLADADD
jgi:deoxyribose-phosphate aldolase